MTEGTKSYLIGYHQFLLHPLWVLMAWKLEYKAWPKWWQLICILFHDIGICGRQYMSDDGAKEGHWIRGARLSAKIVYRITKKNILKSEPKTMEEFFLFSKCYDHKMEPEAFLLCAGHAPKESGYSQSALFIPDKRSFLVSPMWWNWLNYWTEGFKVSNPVKWTKLIEENLKKEEPMGGHELYLHAIYEHTQNENKRELLNAKRTFFIKDVKHRLTENKIPDKVLTDILLVFKFGKVEDLNDNPNNLIRDIDGRFWTTWDKVFEIRDRLKNWKMDTNDFYRTR